MRVHRLLISRFFAVLAAVAVASCAQVPAPRELGEDVTFPRGEALETFEVGFGAIVEKFIEPITADRLAFEGLRGLGAIDPAVSVRRDEADVVLALDGDETARLMAPPMDDVRGWAELTLKMSLAGRRVSGDLRAATPEKLYEAVFDGALSNLDVFSRYAGADEAKRNRAKRSGYGGIGIRFALEDGKVLVKRVMKATPADRAGLAEGDEITTIDGRAVQGLAVREISERLRGPLRSKVVLALRDPDGAQDRDVEITRAHIVPETVRTAFEGGVLHVRVRGFNAKTASSLRKALQAAARDRGRALKGLVLDLRGNPGGLLKQSVRVADLFLEDGNIVSTRGRHPDSIQYYRARQRESDNALPMVVLVDGKSASASEIVAAALQDQGRAVVIGTTSYGKGSVQTVVRLPNDGELTLTWSRFVAPSGYILHGLGVHPVICTSGASVLVPESLTRSVLAHNGLKALTAAWRGTAVEEREIRKNLRRDCPAERRPGRDAELRLARYLLGNMDLFGQVLSLVPALEAPSQARAAVSAR